MSFFTEFEKAVFGGRGAAPPNEVPKPATPTGRRLAMLDATLAWLSKALKSQDPTGLNALDLTAISPIVDALQEGFAVATFDQGGRTFLATDFPPGTPAFPLVVPNQARARRVIGMRYVSSITAAGPTLITPGFLVGGGAVNGSAYFIGDSTIAQDIPTRTMLPVPLYIPPGFGLYFTHPGLAGAEAISISLLVVDTPAGFKLGV